jgi:hypothetical protein
MSPESPLSLVSAWRFLKASASVLPLAMVFQGTPLRGRNQPVHCCGCVGMVHLEDSRGVDATAAVDPVTQPRGRL